MRIVTAFSAVPDAQLDGCRVRGLYAVAEYGGWLGGGRTRLHPERLLCPVVLLREGFHLCIPALAKRTKRATIHPDSLPARDSRSALSDREGVNRYTRPTVRLDRSWKMDTRFRTTATVSEIQDLKREIQLLQSLVEGIREERERVLWRKHLSQMETRLRDLRRRSAGRPERLSA